jgi:leader peptidase (prepilin peptidase)/N-methyltransferase
MMNLPYLNVFLAVYAFCWGAIWGSFLNVVVYRLPRGQSLSNPPSRCPVCQTRIRAYDNIPIVSWLVLAAKCRACGTPIPVRYPGVELLTGLLSLALWMQVYWVAGQSEPLQVVALQFLAHFFFMTALVSIAFIDLDLTIIPHRLTFPAMAWGLLCAVITPKTGAFIGYFPVVDIVDSSVGLLIGGGVIVAIFFGYKVLTGKEGMGLGDATLLGAIGANLGWQSLLFVLMFSSMQAIVVALSIEGVERVTGRQLLLRGVWKDEFWDAHPLNQPADGEAATTSPPDSGSVLETPSVAGESESTVGGEAPEVDEEEENFLKKGLPYGPFLALAALEYIFLGRWFNDWMMGGSGVW